MKKEKIGLLVRDLYKALQIKKLRTGPCYYQRQRKKIKRGSIWMLLVTNNSIMYLTKKDSQFLLKILALALCSQEMLRMHNFTSKKRKL